MRASTLAIATSGTVTLELALHGTPTVVTYAITNSTAFWLKRFFGSTFLTTALSILFLKNERFLSFLARNLQKKRSLMRSTPFGLTPREGKNA